MLKCVSFIKTCSNLFPFQIKNEELCRIQNELEQECDQFRKLKKMIQEHGLPNHEQLIVLQQQVRIKSAFRGGLLPVQKVHWLNSSSLNSFKQVKSGNVEKMVPPGPFFIFFLIGIHSMQGDVDQRLFWIDLK